jgi:hypothetical protein
MARKQIMKKTAGPKPIERAGSSFSDSAAVQPRPELSIYGPSTPQGPIGPEDTPQYG